MPIYAVADDLRILYANQATCDLTGFSDEQLTELTCVYRSPTGEDRKEQVAAGLCPPPDCFSDAPGSGWISIASGDGEPEFRQAIFVPNQFPVAALTFQERPASGGQRATLPSAENTIPGVVVFVYGAPVSSPNRQAGPETDSRNLHAVISEIQYRTTSQTSMDCLVGESPESKRTRRQVRLAGMIQSYDPTAANVLITGPDGAGQDRIAMLVHFANGAAKTGPLITISGSLASFESVQETLVDLANVTGYEKQEPAARLYLKDVDKLDDSVQRLIVQHLSKYQQNASLLATATTKDLRRVIPELRQLASTIEIQLTPLSQRRQDIPFLAQATLEQSNAAGQSTMAGIAPDTLRALQRYDWPGDLEELIRAIDEACRNAGSETSSESRSANVGMPNLPDWLRIALRSQDVNDGPNPIKLDEVQTKQESIDLDAFLRDVEEQLIHRAVHHAGGNKSMAARLLGISRARLLRRLADNDPGDEIPDFTEIDDSTNDEQP